MEKTLCDISAFRFLRIPPQYLSVLPRLPDFDTPFGRRQLRDDHLAANVLGLPLHTLELDGRGITSTVVKPHMWSTPLPPQAIHDTPYDVSVSSPLFTALMLSRHVSKIRLAMIMYELMGTFTLFTPSETLEAAYAQYRKEHGTPRVQHWRRLISVKGKATNLWSRPPLISRAELDLFLGAISQQYCSQRLRQAARLVTGVTASPFEAQASLLLSAPRATGGMGFPELRNNLRINLDGGARRICGLSYVYADLAWEKTEKHPLIVVECQGGAVHDEHEKGLADDNRALALQSMGIEVARITYEQIADERRFEVLTSYLAKKLGIRMRPPAAGTARAMQKLRREIFCDWERSGF